MAARYRPRKEFKFWLYRDKPDEARLVEFIEYCKQTRKWARVVRDGIRLMWSLGEGDTTVLYELFPWLQTQNTLTKLASETENLERQIADLKRIMLEQGGMTAPPAGYPMMKSSGALGGIKKMALPLIDDDDQNTIVLNKSTNTNIMDNFLASFAKLGS